MPVPPRKLWTSAIKYGDLSNQASKDYVFDMDRFTSFEGNTGPIFCILRCVSNRFSQNTGRKETAWKMLKILPFAQDRRESADAGNSKIQWGDRKRF